MKIITRAEWGFDGWRLDPKTNTRPAPSTVNEKTERTEFFTHYQGGPTGYALGVSVPRSIHRMHKANGWKGIGYGHIVTADGTIYEGRGFNLSGSHCPDHNRSGYSAQGHIGAGEKPTPAMLASLRWLYDESCRRSGRTLAKRGHRDGTATACPGDVLYAWVKAGMPAPTTTTTPEALDMDRTELIKILDDHTLSPADGNYLRLKIEAVNARVAAVGATVAALVAAQPGQVLTAAEIEAAAKAGATAAIDAKISAADVTLEVQP